jgi:Ca-activated chloride channel family protein
MRTLITAACLSLFPLQAMAQVAGTERRPPQTVMPVHPDGNLHRRIVVSAVQLTSVSVQIDVVDQIATTRLDMALHNPATHAQEAQIVFPVADGVAVRLLQYDGVGPEPVAEVLTREEARRYYDEIVRSMRDPALVEFIGMGLIRTSAFPVPPGATQHIRLTLEQVLPRDATRIEYVLPRSNSFSTESTAWSVDFNIKSTPAIAGIYSPSHPLTISAQGKHNAKGKIDAAAASRGTIRLTCILQDRTDTPAWTVWTCPEVNSQVAAGSGYFLMIGSMPESALSPEVMPKREVTLAIDRSGSMRGEKWRQAVQATKDTLNGLEMGEWFNVIDYSDSVRSFAPAPVAKTAQSLSEAMAYLDGLSASGGTNIGDALAMALSPQPQRGVVSSVLFLTDGLATVGERSEARLRELAAARNAHGRRIFTFGVGFDVNAPLLTGIARVSSATSTFVLPDEDIEAKVSSVFRGLSGPVVISPRLKAAGEGSESTWAHIRDVEPGVLTDLFAGGQVVIAGRYTGGEPIRLVVEGQRAGGEEIVIMPMTVDPGAASLAHDFVPRAWANMRIAGLLEHIRAAGAESGNKPETKELIDEVIRLSKQFGIMTEYTAFLAREVQPGVAPADAMRADLDAARADINERVLGDRSGVGAVNQELNMKRMASMGGSPAAPARAARPNTQTYYDKSMNEVTVNNVRQIGQFAFYQRGDKWVDSRLLDADGHEVEIAVGSDAYAELLRALTVRGEQSILAQEGDLLVMDPASGKRVLVRAK